MYVSEREGEHMRVCAYTQRTEMRAKVAEEDRARTRESFLHALDLEVSLRVGGFECLPRMHHVVACSADPSNIVLPLTIIASNCRQLS